MNNSLQGQSNTNINSEIFGTNDNNLSSLNSTSSSFTGFFSNITWKFWLFIIFILAFLGLNIFVYLAQGTQTIANLISPVTSVFSNFFTGTLLDASKQTINTSATGAKAGVDIVAGTTTGGIDIIQQTATGVKGALTGNVGNNSAPVVTQSSTATNQLSQNTLNTALNNATKSQSQNPGDDEPTYQADDSYSSIQSGKTASKSGWCYIGEERGIRSCIKVGENDDCMSGDIFPSQEICVNPNLRA